MSRRSPLPPTAPGEGLLGPALQRYFCQFLMSQRQLSTDFRGAAPVTISAERA